MTMTEAEYRKARKKFRGKKVAQFPADLKKALLKEARIYRTSQRELAVSYGVSQSTVRVWLSEASK